MYLGASCNKQGHRGWTEGQYSGKMLAETGSFDILFGIGYWVLGFFLQIYISINIYKYILGYIHVSTYIRVYMIENGRWRMI